MLAIQNFVKALRLPPALQNELAGEHVLRQFTLHLHLPTWLAPAFRPISEAKVEALSVNSYLYFRFMLVVDHLLDAPAAGPQAPVQQAAAGQRLLTYCALFEESIRGLAALFAAQTPSGGTCSSASSSSRPATCRKKP